MQRLLMLIAVTIVVGCTTSADLKQSGDHRSVVDVSSNYQQVYRTMLTTARSCLDGGGTVAASNRVDGQLFTDLGLGEIRYYLTGVIPIDFAYVEIQQMGAGTTVTVSTGGQPAWANDNLKDRLVQWAKGVERCDE